MYDARALTVQGHIVDQRFVEFQAVHRQTREIRQARVVGTGVIDGDAYAQFLPLLQAPGRKVGVREDCGFGNFQFQPWPCQTRSLQNSGESSEKLPMDLERRDIDGYRQTLRLTPAPRRRRVACALEYACA